MRMMPIYSLPQVARTICALFEGILKAGEQSTTTKFTVEDQPSVSGPTWAAYIMPTSTFLEPLFPMLQCVHQAWVIGGIRFIPTTVDRHTRLAPAEVLLLILLLRVNRTWYHQSKEIQIHHVAIFQNSTLETRDAVRRN
jgi:hypothetical protein